MGAAALPIMIGMQVVGGVMGAVNEQKSYKAAARADTENARLTELSGERDSLTAMLEARQQMGAQLVDQGASGTLFSGSNADVVAESARLRDRQIANIRNQSEDEASNYRASAKENKRAGKAALINGILGTVSSAISTGSGMQANSKISGQAKAERAARMGPSSIPVGQIRVRPSAGWSQGSFGGY